MSIEIELRYPTVAFGYANVKVTASSPAELENQLSAYQKQIGLAIQLAGGGDSHAQAVRLIGEELGGKVIEETAPWQAPAPAVEQPWAGTPAVDPFGGPAVESSGPAPFGADPFAAPARDVFLIEVPRDKMDQWKTTDRPYLQKNLPKGTIAWDDQAKRNTIPKSTVQNILDYIKNLGYGLR